MRILTCGAGTLGANLVEHLARQEGAQLELAVLDQDRVEAHNLANQPYLQHQIGKPKVMALAENIQRIQGQRLEVHCKTLTAGNAARWIKGRELVIDCFDNHQARLDLQQACRAAGIPLLHLGLASDYGEICWDSHYRVPPDVARDPCALPLSRTLALMSMVLFTSVWKAFRQCGEHLNLCFTAADLTVSRLA